MSESQPEPTISPDQPQQQQPESSTSTSSTHPHARSYSTPLQPRPPPTSSAYFSLTSRRPLASPPGVRQPIPRYDPRAVLAARVRQAKTSAPLQFQRKVGKENGGRIPRAGGGEDVFEESPEVKWQHEQAERAWREVNLYPSMYNHTKYKTQQRLFSRPEPIFRHSPRDSLPSLQPRSKSPPRPATTSLLDPASCRPQTSDPLLHYLENSWLAPDLNSSAQNAEVTRTKRRFFDSPQRPARTPYADLLGTNEEAQKLLKASQRIKYERERMKTHRPKKSKEPTQTRGRSRQSSSRPLTQQHRQHEIDLLTSQAESFQFRSALDTTPFQTHPVSPERVLDERRPPRTHHTAGILPDKGEYLLHAPPPSFSPHSDYFRHQPVRDPRLLVKHMKRERDWNERHQLTHQVDGW